MTEARSGRDAGSLLQAGVALGIGMGGFADGIVFHQILQLHNMLSALHPPTGVREIELNMVWDGVFHAFTWSMTLAGLVLLFRAGRARAVSWCGRTLAGGALLGWGIFNLVEGVIDHHVLHLHHVVERLGPSMWDIVFLGSGVLLVAAGLALVRGASPAMRRSIAQSP